MHLTGSGKRSDSIRPEFIPAEPDAKRDGIIAWSAQLADDGKMVLVHLVAPDRHAFDPILADKRPEIRVFEIGKHSKDEIEKELKKFRKDFDLQKFTVNVQ